MARPFRKPWVVTTPRRLLGHKGCVSSLEDLAAGGYQNIIGDPEADPKKVTRLVACSGKVYYDLIAARREHQLEQLSLIRFEQLYPFPADDFRR